MKYSIIFGLMLFIAIGSMIMGLIGEGQQVTPDYTNEITVNDASEIPGAVSNILEDVASREFVLTKFGIRHVEVFEDKFIINAEGCRKNGLASK